MRSVLDPLSGSTSSAQPRRPLDAQTGGRLQAGLLAAGTLAREGLAPEGNAPQVLEPLPH